MAFDEFPQERFESVEALIAAIKQRSDDIESMTIQVASGLLLEGPSGEQLFQRGCGAIVKMHDGTSLTLHRDDAAALLTDGLLNRLRKPIKLIPLPEDRLG